MWRKNNNFFYLSFLFLFSLFSQEPQSPSKLVLPPKIKINKISSDLWELNGIFWNKKSKELRMKANILTNQRDLEVLISSPLGRIYESLFLSYISPFHLQYMILQMIIEQKKINAKRIYLDIKITWQDLYGQQYILPINNFLIDKKTNKITDTKFLFIGSTTNKRGYPLAEGEGNIALSYYNRPTIIIAEKNSDRDDEYSINHQIIQNFYLNQEIELVISLKE